MPLRTPSQISQQFRIRQTAAGGPSQFKGQVGTAAAGGAVRALGYRPPLVVSVTRVELAQINNLMRLGLNATDAAQRVLGPQRAGQLLSGASLILAEAGGGAAIGATVGLAVGNPLLGGLIGAGIGALVGAVETLFGSSSEAKPTRLPQTAPRPPVPRFAPVSELAQAAQAAGLRPDFKVFDMGAVTTAPRTRAPVAAAQPVPPPAAPSILSRLRQGGGLVAAGEALDRLLRGQSVSATEFGALAGAVLGSFLGPEGTPIGALQGAAIGDVVGQVVTELERLAVQHFGKPLDQLLSEQGRRALTALEHALAGQPPVHISFPPVGPLPQPLEVAPRQPVPQPLEVAPRRPVQPLEVLPRQPVQLLPQRPPVQPVQPFQPAPRPLETLPAEQPGDCTTADSPVGQLARLLVNCPTFQDELRNKFKVSQRPGRPPEIVIAEPVCLCCDSEQDLQSFMESGGRLGGCTQVKGAPAGIVGMGFPATAYGE